MELYLKSVKPERFTKMPFLGPKDRVEESKSLVSDFDVRVKYTFKEVIGT